MMNFVDMTNEEWEEVRRHHDALVQMGQLELQSEEIHAGGPSGHSRQATPPVGRKVCELDDLIVGISH